MSVFCIILCVLFVLRCLEKKTLTLTFAYKEIFFLYLAVSVTVNVGYAFKRGNFDIAYSTAISLVLFVLSVLFILKGTYDRRIFRAGLLFWCALVAGLILFYIRPYQGGVIQSIVDWDAYVSGKAELEYHPVLSSGVVGFALGALRFPVILSVAFRVCKAEDVKKWVSRLHAILPFVLIYGYAELVAKRFFQVETFSGFFNGLFGSFLFVSRLQGFTSEASQYAVVLFIYSLIVIIDKEFRGKPDMRISGWGRVKKNQTYWVEIVLIYLLMVYSRSICAYYLLLVSILCVMMNEGVSRKIILAFLIFSVVFMIWMVGLPAFITERLGRISSVFEAIGSGQQYTSGATSEGARLISIYQMLVCLVHRPLFGVGMGVTDAHAAFFAVLGNFGLVGTFLYYRLWWLYALPSDKKSKWFFCLMIVSTFLVGGFGYYPELYLPFLVLGYSCAKKGVATYEINRN